MVTEKTTNEESLNSQPSRIPPSTEEELDAAVLKLSRYKEAWINHSLQDKIRYLDDSISRFGELMDDWVKISLEAKRAATDPYAAGLEWISGPVTILRYLQGLRRALKDIQEVGAPSFVGPVSRLPNGQVTVHIYPSTLYERIITSGVTTEVWMEPGVTIENLPETQAIHYDNEHAEGKVVLVLGAGNVAGIPVTDSLYKLYVENHVVVLKMSPVNEYLGPFINKCFAKLISDGYLQIVYGGAMEGNYLCHHSGVDEIHMTGSDKTFDAIVFGAGDEGKKRKKRNQPIINKHITSELGSIAPAIIVPGPWNSSDMHYQAEQLVSHLCDSAGCSCSRTRVILNYSDWNLRDDLIQNIREIISAVPLRTAYYPGARSLHEKFVTAHPRAEQFGQPASDELPWTFIPGLDSDDQREICFTTESFCPVISETTIAADSIPDYIDRAVEFANRGLWGSLSATIIIHPKSLRDPKISNAFKRALMNLRVGEIIVNGIPGMAWIMTTPPWGSFPGNSIQDIQSGTGYVNNVYMFSRPQKVVVRCPFRQRPKPFWFNSQADIFEKVARKVAQYDLKPSWLKVPGIVRTALGF